MDNLTAGNVWAIIAGAAAALVLLVNAWEKIMAVVHALRAPDTAQDDRLAALEQDVGQIKKYLDNDKHSIDRLTEGDRVTKHAILALLGHGIDGNNVDEMTQSKRELEKYLINR